MSRKLPSRATVEKWIKDFPELEFDGTELRCNVCDSALSWGVKTRVTEHVAGELHKARTSGNRTTKENQKQLNMDLVKAMISCNMPWSTLHNPAFRELLQNCINGKYNKATVPAESTLRTGYLSPTCKEFQATVASEVYDRNIWVSVGETRDDTERVMTHVLVGGMAEAKPMPARLISSTVLESLNSETISEYVDNSLRKIWGDKVDDNKKMVMLYVTDASNYMKASAECLKSLYKYGNLLHVTCFAHGLHGVAEAVRDCFPIVDQLISSVKNIFLKAASRRKLFREKLPYTPLPPTVTRCGTWIEAATYYYVNFDDVKAIIEELNPNEALCVLQAQQAFNDPTIRQDLRNIHYNFSRIYLSIKSLETISPEYTIANAVNNIFELRQFIFQLSEHPTDYVKNKFEETLENNPGFRTICAIVDLLEGQEVDFAQPNVNVTALKNFKCFRYAPVTLVDVEKSLSSYKWISNDRSPNLTPKHLEQLLLIHFNSRTD